MKRISIITVFIFTILLYYQEVSASYRPIIISGTIPDNYVNDFKLAEEINFYAVYEQSQPWNTRQILPVPLKNNQFKVKFIPSATCGYFELKSLYMYSIFRTLFLIEEGDSIHIEFTNPKTVVFSGKGAAKLNFQHNMGREINKFEQLLENSDANKIPKSRERLERVSNVAMARLNQYKNTWSQDVFELIKLNTFSAIQAYYLFSIKPINGAKIDSIYQKSLKKELDRIYIDQNSFSVPRSFGLKRSFIYLDYMISLNELIASVYNDFQSHPPFHFLYDNLKIQYDGELRDELIKNYFLKYSRFYPEAASLLPDAINTVMANDCKQVLEDLLIAKGKGQQAYNFNFEGLDGKFYELDDFKGSVVVIDTWFNGCGNCITLAKNMKPIMEYFSKEKVVFLSVNVDKDFKKFSEGAKTGDYGSEKSIYMYTNGTGQNHPMLKHYKYIAYPNLLIIGKDGNIISGNPIVPSSVKTQNQLIELLKSSL